MEPAAVKAPLVPRRFRNRVSPLRIGVLALSVTLVFVYLAFTKTLPWQHPFELRAVFETSGNLQLNSPVRIAGVDVGTVVEVKRAPGTNTAEVTMEIQKNGLPIHTDANMKIRSRLFLEGNFFVDLSPGTPTSPDASSGDTIPVTQTATPVQLDQVLTALQANDRAALQDLLQGLGDAFMRKPTAAENAAQDPDVRGKTAAQSLNQALAYAPEALKSSAQVNQALLGTQTNDLAKLIAGAQKVTSALAASETQLSEFVTNFNRFTAIFAAQESNLRQTVALLGPTVRHAHASLTSLNAALPELDEFARNFTPVVDQTQETIAAVKPWIVQTRALVSAAEGGGLLAQLRPAARSLAILSDQSIDLFQEVYLTSRCFDEVVLPAGNEQVIDYFGNSGVQAYREFFYLMVGFAGQNGFDGNGSFFRTGTGGGNTTISTGPIKRSNGTTPLVGQAIEPPIGTQPRKQSKQTPYKLDYSCYRNGKPNLNGPASKVGPADTVVP